MNNKIGLSTIPKKKKGFNIVFSDDNNGDTDLHVDNNNRLFMNEEATAWSTTTKKEAVMLIIQ